ncbi:MAG: vWA domain-containing protein [Candidatus Nanopelagicales bacterium]
MTSVLTGRVRRGARGLMAGSLALGLAATALAVGATSANAVVDPAPAWVNNPDLPASCGLDVMLVLDASKSIATSNSTADVKAAASTLVTALKDTNTRVGITSFGRGPIEVQPLVDDTSDSAAATGALGAAIAAYTPDTVEGTNWEAGIRTASQLFATAGKRAGVTQLMIVVTDGAPNYYLDASGAPVAGSSYPSASLDAMTQAMNRTNQFKQPGGTRVLGIGVGSDFSTGGATTRISYLEHLSQYAVLLSGDPNAVPPTAVYAPVGKTSGPTNVINPVTNANYTAFDPKTTDTLIQPDYATLGASFKAIADNVCDSTLTVTSYASSPTNPATFRNGGAGWATKVELNTAGPDWVNPTADTSGTLTNESTTSNAAGTAVYQWFDSTANWTRTATVTLTQKANYTFNKLLCRTKPKGGNWSAWTAPTVTNNQFQVTVGGGQVSCVPFSKYTGTPQAVVSIAPRSVVKTYGASTTVLAGKVVRPVCTASACTYVPVKSGIVYVQRYLGGGNWSSVGRAAITSTGAWALAVKPVYNSYYRGTYLGATGLLGNSSANALIRVSNKVSIKLNKNNVALGTTVVFSGAVAPNKKTQLVYLQAYIGGHWKNIKNVKLTSTSTYAFAWKTTSRVDYKWRVVKPADSLNYTGISPVVTLVVK